MFSDRTTNNDYNYDNANPIQPLYTVLTTSQLNPITAWSGTPVLKVQSLETGEENAFT